MTRNNLVLFRKVFKSDWINDFFHLILAKILINNLEIIEVP